MKTLPANRYKKLLCEFYDAIARSAARRDREFFIGYSRAAKGPTLELGCGTGRLLIPTAEAGCTAVGLDLSAAMLAKCRERVRALPAKTRRRVRVVKGNMAAFSLGRKFGLITIPYRGFQHLLTVGEQISCLRCAHRHLKPGGKLILDMFNVHPEFINHPSTKSEMEVCSNVRVADGRRFRMTWRAVKFHPAEQYNDFENIFYVRYPNGRKEKVSEMLPLRYLFRFEAEHLLARCGFRMRNFFGSFSKTPVRKNSRHQLIVAEKV